MTGLKAKSFYLAVVILPLVILLGVTGCSSSLVLGKIYDGFGSSTAKAFKSHATFNNAQSAQIDSLAASYHSWHRSTQMNRYSEFLRALVMDVDAADELTFEQASGWWQSVRNFTDDMRVCNPFNVAAGLLAGLSDKQVNQVAGKLRKDLNGREDEYRAEAPEQRIDRRVKEISKWGRRAGMSFKKQQKDKLRQTLQSQVSLGAQRYELRRIWMEEFILLLRQREQADFATKITEHINANWRLTETAFPDEWQTNERLWTEFIKDYINLQTPAQRRVFTDKMNSTARTLNKLSGKEVTVDSVCHRS